MHNPLSYQTQIAVLNFLIAGEFSRRITSNAKSMMYAIDNMLAGQVQNVAKTPWTWIVVGESNSIRRDLMDLDYNFYEDFWITTEQDTIDLKNSMENRRTTIEVK